jgi:hypothetical protein
MRILLSSLIIALACPALLTAADHRVEKLTSPPSSGSLAAPIEAKLSNIGVRVIRGSSREVCSIWLCKEWPVKAFDAAGDLLYPFTPGQLIGVVHYRGNLADQGFSGSDSRRRRSLRRADVVQATRRTQRQSGRHDASLPAVTPATRGRRSHSPSGAARLVDRAFDGEGRKG